jgi:hypothetical protein
MMEFLSAWKEEYQGQRQMVHIVAHLLDETAGRSVPRETHHESTLPLFESSVQCPLKPSAYLQRILKYSLASFTTPVVALIYLQRLAASERASGGRLRLTNFNFQRLLLTAGEE